MYDEALNEEAIRSNFAAPNNQGDRFPGDANEDGMIDPAEYAAATAPMLTRPDTRPGQRKQEDNTTPEQLPRHRLFPKPAVELLYAACRPARRLKGPSVTRGDAEQLEDETEAA